MSADYDGTVEQVHRAFADEQYWLARLADSGADDATLDSMTVRPDGGIAVSTTQVLRRRSTAGHRDPVPPGRPAYRARARSGARSTADRSTATVTGDISGAPVTLGGDAVLTPAKGAGARLAFHGTVEVRVPLVGGKIESFIGSQLVDLLIAEQRFTTQWLTENP